MAGQDSKPTKLGPDMTANLISGTDFELQPAYGRDYKSKAAVEAAFWEGKDFLGDYQLGFKPVGIQDFAPGSKVMLRYGGLRRVTVVTV
jgi:hypothetical protein